MNPSSGADGEAQQCASEGIERCLKQDVEQRWAAAPSWLREGDGNLPEMRQDALVQIEDELNQFPGDEKRKDDQDERERRRGAHRLSRYAEAGFH
jgi:hypothetical protein